jgi:hypothetical protein
MRPKRGESVGENGNEAEKEVNGLEERAETVSY